MTSVFESHEDFYKFRREVAFTRRYMRSDQSEKFLAALLSSCAGRTLTIARGQQYFRAQLGHEWKHGPLGGPMPYPFSAARMKPLDDRAHEGRVNPKGIPCLYVASTVEAAMSEMRPGISAQMSVATLQTVADLCVINCTQRHGVFVGLFEPEIEKRDDTVWSTIDQAFGDPIVRVEDRADYAATQIIAELLRFNGYDGIAYASQFDPRGYNVALFDLNVAQQVNCAIYSAAGVKYEFKGPWTGYDG
jgi:RES domain-containing protein